MSADVRQVTSDIRKKLILLLISGFCALTCTHALASVPITTDSRIKTFVFNENEVYSIVTHYGYQSNIELGKNEEIATVSVGDRVGWQIVPAGRRIFIRAMEENAHTNMTVVTNKRAYQFDIREAGQAALMAGEELVYVVRFYYPDEPDKSPPMPVVAAVDMAPIRPIAPTGGMMGGAMPPMSYGAPNAATSGAMPPLSPLTQSRFARPVAAPVLRSPPAPSFATRPTATPLQSLPGPSLAAAFNAAPASSPFSAPTPTPVTAPAPLPAAAVPAPTPAPIPPTPMASNGMNYNYTFSGPTAVAPLKIYDDGRATYFKLPPTATASQVAVLSASGQEMAVPINTTPEGLTRVNIVAPRFAITSGKSRVVVYNESVPGA